MSISSFVNQPEIVLARQGSQNGSMNWGWRQKLLTIATFLLGLSGGVNAQSPNATQWFKPHSSSSPTANSVQVSLFGKTQPESSISIDPNLIVTANPEFDPSSVSKNLGSVLSTLSDDNGYFKLTFDLPLGVVQVPVAIAANNGEKQNFLISFSVKSTAVKISLPTLNDDQQITQWRKELTVFAEAQSGVKKKSMNAELVGLWIHLGVGTNYQSHSQSLPNTANMKFESLKFGGMGFLAGYAKETWVINLGHRQTPGEAGGVSSPYTLETPKFVWSNSLLEGGWVSRQTSWREQARITYLFGFQQHFVPQFEPTNDNRIILRSFEISAASLGFEIATRFTEMTQGSLSLRYQHPISSTSLDGREFKVDPDLSFDGSLGLLYQLGPQSHFGLYWFGHWLKYKFSSLSNDGITYREGDQSLFYSNLDLRYVIHVQ